MNKTLYIWFPVALFAFILIADRPFPAFLPNLTGGEQGLVETLQVLFLFLACGWALYALFQPAAGQAKWVKAWIGIGIMAIIYVLLEEISYGQHFFQWDTPAYWQALNDQNETNLHNTSSWLDQKPRLLLELGVLVGGIIVPLLRRFRPQVLPDRFAVILPESALFVTALLAILPRIYERVIEIGGLESLHLFARTSEVQELYFYFFVLLYFICFTKKPRQNDNW